MLFVGIRNGLNLPTQLAFTGGIFEEAGWTQSNRYQEGGFGAARFTATASRDAAIGLITAGAASWVSAGDVIGDTAMAVNYAGRGYIAYQSGAMIGNGVNDISDGNYVRGSGEVLLGGLGVAGTLTGPLVPKSSIAAADGLTSGNPLADSYRASLEGSITPVPDAQVLMQNPNLQTCVPIVCDQMLGPSSTAGLQQMYSTAASRGGMLLQDATAYLQNSELATNARFVENMTVDGLQQTIPNSGPESPPQEADYTPLEYMGLRTVNFLFTTRSSGNTPKLRRS
jgi:hypothetical protein